jgi:putative hydrolase of the HAD superfamily
VSALFAKPELVRGVVFDLDDCLFPELQYVDGGLAAAAQAVSVRFGNDPDIVLQGFRHALDEDLARHGQARTVFDSTLASLGLPADPDTIASLVAAYRAHRPDIKPYPDVIPTLEALSVRRVLGVVTDGPVPVQRAKFDALGIAWWIAEAVFTDEYGLEKRKPDEFAFALIEQRLGLEPEQLVYVGDNPAKDFFAPRRRGWATLRIRRPEGLHRLAEPAPGFEADAEIDGLGQIVGALGF